MKSARLFIYCSCGAGLSTWRNLFLHWVKGRRRGWPCATDMKTGAP